MNIGNAIKQCRKQCRMTQNELADKSGISAAYLSLIERNKRTDPGVNTLQELADSLNVPLSILVLLGTDDSDFSGIDETIIAKLKSATTSLMETSHGSSTS